MTIENLAFAEADFFTSYPKTMEQLELIKASTKYNDMLGTVAVDFQDRDDGPRSFKQLLEQRGFDFGAFFPYAYEIKLGESTYEPFDLRKEGYLIVNAVSKSEVGSDHEAIRLSALRNEGLIPTHQFVLNIPLQEIFQLFKRFEMTLSITKTDQQLRGALLLSLRVIRIYRSTYTQIKLIDRSGT